MEAKNPELLSDIKFDLFGNSELANVFKLVGILYADNGAMPGWDLLIAELTNRVTNPDKQRFYVELVGDIKDKDATGITTEDLIKKLKTQRQFRTILDGAGKLVDAVDSRDADLTVGIMRELYESMFVQEAGASFDSSDMVRMAGNKVKFDFEKTGITGLDKRGGIIKGGLVSVAGASKAGKSLLAQQMLTYSHDTYEGSSAYFPYEQSASEIRCRILSARSDIDIGLVTSDLLTPEQRLNLRIAEVGHLCEINSNMIDFCTQTKKESDEEFWPMFWDHFQPRPDRFYLMQKGPDWDNLFIQMQMMVDMKNVKRFVVDYPMIIPRGRTHRDLASWEYNLLMSRNLKSFARNNGVRVIAPAQYDDKNDNIRYASGVINDVDLMLTMKHENGDKEAGTVTIGFKAFRNYLSLPGEPILLPFKLERQFHVSKFGNLDF